MKIKEIKDFGIYKDYKWNEIDELKPFNKKNIIYGWNYSGKTTLSRILSMFVFMSYFRKLYLICQLVYYGLLNYFHLELFFLF